MTRDHPQGTDSTETWTPAWLGDFPEAEDAPADEPPPARPAHAAPDHRDDSFAVVTDGGRETRELVSTGWAEERSALSSGPHAPIGSLRSLGAVAVTGRRPTRPPPPPQRKRTARGTGSATGLVALVLLALLSAFFAWVTAEPLWLAAGHGQPGAVTVTRCTGDRCLGTFTAAGGGFTRNAVPVMGDAPEPGASAPARMTSARGARAYVDADVTSRAGVGVALILLCGLGIVRATGVRRLPSTRARTTVMVLSLAAPFTLLAAMLVVTY